MTDTLIYKYAYNQCTPDERRAVRDMLVSDFSECFAVVGLMKTRAVNDIESSMPKAPALALAVSPKERRKTLEKGRRGLTDVDACKNAPAPKALPDIAYDEEMAEMAEPIMIKEQAFGMSMCFDEMPLQPAPDFLGILNRYLQSE